jgi:hypothetical protein
VYYTVSTYVEKTGPGNFLPYANLGTMGHENDLPLMSERTVQTLVALGTQDVRLCVCHTVQRAQLVRSSACMYHYTLEFTAELEYLATIVPTSRGTTSSTLIIVIG